MATDQDLDAFFAAAREAGPAPSDDLVARVLRDADKYQPGAQAEVRREPQRRGVLGLRRARHGAGRWLAALFVGRAFGGGAALGAGTAMLAGLAIGLLQPAPVAALTTAIFDDAQVSIDLMPLYDTLLDEVSADE